MNRSALLSVVLVALAVLAGCSAPSDAGQTLDTVEYPDGVSKAGVTNATALVDSHETALTNASYTVSQTRTMSTGNDSKTAESTVSMDASSERVRSVTRQSGLTVRTFYANGTVYVNRSVGDASEVRTQSADRDFGAYQSQFAGARGDFLTQLLDVVTLNATGVTTRGDATLITYDVTGVEESAAQQFEGSNVSGSLTVDTDGQVRHATFEQATGDRTLTVEVTYSGVGDTTVETPGWVVDARESAA